MNRKHLSVLAVVAAVAAVAAQATADPPKELPAAAKRELKTLAGKWRVTKFVYSDHEAGPGEGDDPVVVTFKDGSIDFGGVTAAAVVELDPETDPKCLDFKVRADSGVFKKGTTYESVYRRNGDTLSWAVCIGREKVRPAGFDKPTDAGVMVMVLARVKE